VLKRWAMTAVGPEDAQEGARPVNGPFGAASKESASAVSEDDDDLTLVRRAQQGDRKAFRALFDKYHRRVFAVALGVVKNPQDAHDIVQDAFIKVHRHLPTFQGASSFYTWLYRIAMNLSIDHIRRKKAARQVDFDDALRRDNDAEDPGHLIPSLQADPGKTQSRKELSQQIQGALGTLPEIHRKVILLREVEGLSYEEIATVMKVPKGTIMSRLFHARRKMQAALADYVAGELTPQDTLSEEDTDAAR
jgi:RNA polymerase sigma-70 factor (ECF subfamily)